MISINGSYATLINLTIGFCKIKYWSKFLIKHSKLIRLLTDFKKDIIEIKNQT